MEALRPLRGIRVVDFSWVLAGPLGTRLLANFGAEVIRIEATRNTIGDFRPQGVRNPSVGAFRNLVDVGKRSLAVDPRNGAGREVVRRLIGISDVVAENFRPGVLDRMGFDYEGLRALNPSIVVVHLPGCAPDGPWRERGTFGNMILGASGLSSISRFPDRAPRGPGVAYADFTSPYLLASAVIAALRERERTGVGQEIWLDQLSATVSLLGVEWMQYTSTGEPLPARGNRDLNYCPHGVYPTRGEDEWCALAVDGDREWRALCELIGAPGLASDARFATHAERKTNEDAIDEVVSGWTGLHDRWELADRLQARGIAAAAVANLRDMLEVDPHLRHHYQRLRQPSDPDVEIVTVGEAIRPGGMDLRLERAPEPGEHNDYVLRDLLDLSQEEIDDLAEAGAFTASPTSSSQP
jgi:crotonobetainyl-CoA:carnitine CoA-transferase CaiB-like acyl-CoA transferase